MDKGGVVMMSRVGMQTRFSGTREMGCHIFDLCAIALILGFILSYLSENPIYEYYSSSTHH